ncbi:MAG: metal-dependent transcriptional regulator [Spirochaetota bacterium]|nr:metal-dependent transcriptional regulator [Spirochaetota bacterium]
MDINTLHSRFPAAADYLSQIFLIERDYTTVTNMKLAERLQVSKPAVTQSIKRLSKLGLVQQDRYGVIQLTDEGRDIAKQVMIRHYLIEHVLVDMLGYPWEKSDREAKQLQVIISDELKDHLQLKLGGPQTCPHGNPFPDTPGEQDLLRAPRLIQATVGSQVELLRITEEGEEIDGLLDFCFHNNLRPGTLLHFQRRDSGGIVLSKVREKKTFTIPLEYARHMCYSDRR